MAIELTLNTTLSAAQKNTLRNLLPEFQRHAFILFLAVMLCLMPVLGHADGKEPAAPQKELSDTEKKAKEAAWENCLKEQRIESGADVCFEACKKETGINEFNIGVPEMKDRLAECQYERKCLYYKALYQYTCEHLINGKYLPSQYLHEWQNELKIPDKYKDKWVPESINENNN